MNTSLNWIPMAAVILLLFAATACTAAQSGAATAFPPEISLTDDNNGQRVDARSGQVLVISLKGNPTTGYTWEASNLPAFIKLEGEPEYKADSNLVGSSGRLTLRFKVVGAGDGKLDLIYHRPWEKDVAPINTYSLQISARS